MSQELLYGNILLKNIPRTIDLGNIKHKKTLELISKCYAKNPTELEELYATEIYEDKRVIVIEEWGEKKFLRNLLNKERNLISGEIFFTNVKYDLDVSMKLLVSKASGKIISKINIEYEKNKVEFRNYFPTIIIEGQSYIKLPCRLFNFKTIEVITSEKIIGYLYFSNVQHNGHGKILKIERERLFEIHQYLRGFSYEYIIDTYITQIENPQLEIVNIRGRDYIKIPHYLDIEYFFRYSDDNKKPIDSPLISHDKNMINKTIELIEPVYEPKREPIGKTQPSKKFINRQLSSTHKSEFKNGNISPNKIKKEITTIIRDRVLVSQLKELYNNVCQLCGEKIETGLGKYYTEVHHIQPLGIHKGPDIKENMIVLCPNDHAMFDKGAITIDLCTNVVKHGNPNSSINERKIVLKHFIDERYIKYHNEHIYLK